MVLAALSADAPAVAAGVACLVQSTKAHFKASLHLKHGFSDARQ
jgi:hypothetical protein